MLLNDFRLGIHLQKPNIITRGSFESMLDWLYKKGNTTLQKNRGYFLHSLNCFKWVLMVSFT